ncbi:MAG: ATP-dependent DNA helicase RecG [Deltaproteobacteria bacterium]|nr:ATP-dependent DNA helicase RecG [Deltaproteobacteria bacterium]
MSPSPFAEALDALRRPLEFAAADDFARLPRLRGFGASVRAAAERAERLAIPPEARSRMRRVASWFPDGADVSGIREAVQRALAELAPLSAPDFADSALGLPLTTLPGVGPRRAETFAKRELRCIADLLFLLPSRYDDRRSLVAVGALEVGRRATFVARVLVADFTASRGRGRMQRAFLAVAGDETGSVNLKWFHGGEPMRERLRKGALLLVTGDVRRYRFSKELLHPEIEVLEEAPAVGQEGAGAPRDAAAAPSVDRLRRIVPVYSSVEGVPPRTLRRLVDAAVATSADVVEGFLPERLVRERRLPAVATALREVHEPAQDAELEPYLRRRSPAHERLVLEELFLLQLGLEARRIGRAREPGIALPRGANRVRAAASGLPFRLTAAQERVVREIDDDLAQPHPMHRLLQGDVGSGKTAVAFLAAVRAAANACQTALLAPTELLAEQHERTLQRLAASGGGATALRIAVLTASLSRAQSQTVRSALAAGEIDLVVGTHALLSEEVRFSRLALAVVDEQHRFGVAQRQALLARDAEGRAPHLLVMTATPIPRTLALTLYGDLDVSVIDELPPGRSPITTDVLRAGEGRRVLDLLRQTLARGEQACVVYPLVEESEKSDLRAATESAGKIAAALPGKRVDLVHGRVGAGERAAAMARFERGETDVLVSTSVIEVGVDVPNATLMIVEHAERFGLAQLHQLRGRVGRGARPGTCLLMARGSTEESEARLRALVETTDGFAIADADLRIRGPGEFLGTRQSGRIPNLRLADLLRDADLVAVARRAAAETLRTDPGLQGTPRLARAVERRFGDRLALAGVG